MLEKRDNGNYETYFGGVCIALKYVKDEYSYAKMQSQERGVYFSIMPGNKTTLSNGMTMTESSPTEGVKCCIMPTSKKNQKKMDSLAVEINGMIGEIEKIRADEGIRAAVGFVYGKYRTSQ